MEKKADSKKRGIPFWLQIILILLCGALVSGAVYLLTQSKLAAEREAKKPRYTVTFAYQDGTVIDTRQVKEGAGTFPPEFETDGVFRGWSGAFNEVKSDVEVHPMTYELAGDENLFCFDSVYVQEGETFSITVQLAGDVNISTAEIGVDYDTEVMEYIQASPKAFCTVSESEAGTLLLTLDSGAPITEETALATITFRAKKMDVYSTQINLRCISGTLSVDGKETPATVTTINNKIYYLQEVSR